MNQLKHDIFKLLAETGDMTARMVQNELNEGAWDVDLRTVLDALDSLQDEGTVRQIKHIWWRAVTKESRRA